MIPADVVYLALGSPREDWFATPIYAVVALGVVAIPDEDLTVVCTSSDEIS